MPTPTSRPVGAGFRLRPVFDQLVTMSKFLRLGMGCLLKARRPAPIWADWHYRTARVSGASVISCGGCHQRPATTSPRFEPLPSHANLAQNIAVFELAFGELEDGRIAARLDFPITNAFPA
jgi:hypothetical protein